MVRFAGNDDVLVAEQRGLVKRYEGLSDTTPETVLNLARNVHNFWDRGLLGMVPDPNYASNKVIYVLYAHDAAIGGTAPRWGNPASPEFDGCPTPPGATGDGCVISGRLSRIDLDAASPPVEQVLIEDWCQQYPSHSIGSLEFDAAGNLYATAGDGASFNFADSGQDGTRQPVRGPGGSGRRAPQPGPARQDPGAGRPGDPRRIGDPDQPDDRRRAWPATRTARAPTRTRAGSSPTACATRSGSRSRPTTSSGSATSAGTSWEELNRMPTQPGSVVNFGWPCYEGAGRQGGYDSANLSICENLYTEDAIGDPVTAPALAYNHSAQVVPGESCPTGSSSVAGVDFYGAGPFPDAYDEALFFADYSRDCIWVVRSRRRRHPRPGAR